MKIKNIFAAIMVVLAFCPGAPGQSNPGPATPQGPVTAQGPQTPGAPAPTNAPAPEPMTAPLPEGRTVSYSPLVGPDTASNAVPVYEEAPADVNLDDVALPVAIQSLASQANLNVQFDPNLLVTADGHPITPPQVTVKWKNLTAMQALRALLDNWGWQLVWEPRTKVGRITRKDMAAKEPLVVTVVQLRYGNPTNLMREVEGTLSPGSAIVPDIRTHQLIVRTTEKELPGVEALIRQLDTATRQVLVEARIVETSKDITTAKGVDWTGTLAAQHVSFGNGLTQGTTQSGTTVLSGTPSAVASASSVSPGGSIIPGATGSSPVSTLTSNVTSFTSTITGNTSQGGGFSASTAHGFSPATAFLNADGVSAVLSFLNTDSDTKTIAFPRTVALDGVPTEFVSIQNVPIFTQTQSAPAGGSASGLATIQPNYDLSVNNTILNEVGVKLNVTPRIAGPTNVLLDLRPEISQQGPLVTETLNGQPNQAPTFTRNRITTQASVPSGYTLVLGGMDQDVVNKTYTKVPFFGDLPGLGSVFRSDSKAHQSQTILIFVTPTIIGDADYHLADSTFEKRRPVKASEMNETAWDSGEPYDWTKPKTKTADPNYQP